MFGRLIGRDKMKIKNKIFDEIAIYIALVLSFIGTFGLFGIGLIFKQKHFNWGIIFFIILGTVFCYYFNLIAFHLILKNIDDEKWKKRLKDEIHKNQSRKKNHA